MLKGLLDTVSLGDIPRLLLATYLGQYFGYYSHEFAHYFAARLYGIRPTQFLIAGWGPTYSGNHFGTRFILPLILNPAGHFGVQVYVETITLRSAVFFCAAGILANLLFGIVFFVLSLRYQSLVILAFALVSLGMGLGQIVAKDGQDIWNLLMYHKL